MWSSRNHFLSLDAQLRRGFGFPERSQNICPPQALPEMLNLLSPCIRRLSHSECYQGHFLFSYSGSMKYGRHQPTLKNNSSSLPMTDRFFKCFSSGGCFFTAYLFASVKMKERHLIHISSFVTFQKFA